MKIGFMVRNMNEKGGINVYTRNLFENILRQNKTDEFVFIYNDKKFIGTYSEYYNVKEVFVKSSNKIIWDQILVPKILKKEKVDVVFNPKLSIPVFTKSKKVLIIHGAEQFAVKSAFPWQDRVYVQIFMRLYGLFADKILTTTKSGINDLSKYLNLSKEKFTYVYEGVHERFKIIGKDELNYVKVKYNLPEKFILFVGGLTPLKNFSRAAKAFDLLAEKNDIGLVVVGFNRFKFEKDLEAVEKLQNKKRIIFSGFVPDEDLPSFYSLSSLFLFPSLYEGFGLPVLEAMACGCPVVTSKTGCIKEVTDGAALLVEPYNIQDILEKMELLLNNPDLKEQLVRKGFERVQNFSWEKCASETMKVFYSVLPTKSPSFYNP